MGCSLAELTTISGSSSYSTPGFPPRPFSRLRSTESDQPLAWSVAASALLCSSSFHSANASLHSSSAGRPPSSPLLRSRLLLCFVPVVRENLRLKLLLQRSQWGPIDRSSVAPSFRRLFLFH